MRPRLRRANPTQVLINISEGIKMKERSLLQSSEKINTALGGLSKYKAITPTARERLKKFREEMENIRKNPYHQEEYQESVKVIEKINKILKEKSTL